MDMNALTDRSANQGRLDALVLLLLALLIGFMPIPSDPDLWFHLADGEYILSHKTVPTTDPFSFTAGGQLWVPHSWLFDVGTYLAWTKLGPRAAEAGMAVVFMAAVAISFSIMVRRGAEPMWAAVICAGLALAAGNTRGLRPQVFSLLLCNLAILFLIRHQDRPRFRLLLYLPLIFLLWAQLHGAAVMGLVVVAVWLAGRAIARNWREVLIGAGALGLSVVAVLITPHRINLFQYLVLTMKLKALSYTQEWQPPRLLPVEKPDVYLYVLVAGLIVLLARRGRRSEWAPIGLAVALILLAFTGVRHIPLACIAAVPLMAQILGQQDTWLARKIEWPWLLAPAAGIVLLAALWRYPTPVQERYAAHEPIKGAQALAGLARPLRVFTTHNTGSYVLFAGPKDGSIKVFLDSRPDVYGDKIFNEAWSAMHGRNWEAIFKKWNIDAAVLQRGDKLAEILPHQPGWKLLAEDPGTVTFVKEGR